MQNLDLDDNRALTSLDLSSLSSVNRDVRIRRTGLTALTLPNLEVAYNILVESSPTRTVALPSLRLVPYMVLKKLGVEALDLPDSHGQVSIAENASLRQVGLDCSGQEVDVVDNPALETLEFGDCTSARVWVENNAILASAAFSTMTSTSLLLLRGNGALQTVTAPVLTSAGGIHMSGSPLLASVDFPQLATISGGLTVQGTGLIHLGAFARLRSRLADALNLSDNPSLTDVSGLGGLGDAAGADPIVGGSVVITGNTSLQNAVVQALLDALDAKYAGNAFPGGVTTNGNGG